MVRFLLLGLLPLWLAGCAAWPGGARGWPAGGAPAGDYDFNWQLSGDPAVAPLQVFSGAGRTWLQFAPERTPPAVFAQTPAGLQPLPYTRQGPYVIVEGAWPALVLRGGHHAARADRHPRPPAAWAAPGLAGSMAAADAAQGGDAGAAAPSRPLTPASLPTPASAPPTVSPTAPSTVPPSQRLYRAGLPDTTLRAVLSRWAGEAGWMFEPQHWAVDADIPLAGNAEFSGDFKTAVRELLAATELADRPLQPCFYSNQVLRVVPLTQACDRSVAAGSRS